MLLEQVIIAKVVAAGKHENSDHLTVCKIDTGKEEIQVICGAPNVKVGIKTALAPIGTVIPNLFTDGVNYKIKKTKLRGVASYGMLCSAKELGISDDDSGILEFPEEYEIGLPLSKYIQC